MRRSSTRQPTAKPTPRATITAVSASSHDGRDGIMALSSKRGGADREGPSAAAEFPALTGSLAAGSGGGGAAAMGAGAGFAAGAADACLAAAFAAALAALTALFAADR